MKKIQANQGCIEVYSEKMNHSVSLDQRGTKFSIVSDEPYAARAGMCGWTNRSWSQWSGWSNNSGF